MAQKINIERKNQVIQRDGARVICRLLIHGGNPARANAVVQRVLRLDESEVKKILDKIRDEFSDRHLNIKKNFRQHFRHVQSFLSDHSDMQLSEERKLLIGAYFTMEYAIESAALFNPSIVPHPDQSDVPEGSVRFIMSLRAVGEGHISSLVFRSGIIDRQGELIFDEASSLVDTPDLLNPVYDRQIFYMKLQEMGACNEETEHVIRQLPEEFNLDELKQVIAQLSDKPRFSRKRQLECFRDMQRLADSNYEIDFQDGHDLSERVIFPVSEEEQGGIEDARFVQFHDDDGQTIYYGTYTAFDGKTIMPQLIETRDFQHFKMCTLNGKAVQNKNLALFPRKINGNYVMLSRQDGENNHIMFSDHLHFWHKAQIIQKPCEPWELIQVGNCGSPLETEHGWLVLTHGVGPMRTYSIGAILLDLDDPTQVIGRLKEPLLKAMEHERVGYVPNVVYTCGSIIHNGRLIIPYSMSDIQPATASVDLEELIGAMKQNI